MPIRHWTVLCEEMQDQQGRVSLIHVFINIQTNSLPVMLSRFSVVSGLEGEIGEEFTLRVNFRTPEGKPYGPPVNPVRYTFRKEVEVVSNEFADVPFIEYGNYGIEIELNGSPVHVIHLAIMRGSFQHNYPFILQ